MPPRLDLPKDVVPCAGGMPGVTPEGPDDELMIIGERVQQRCAITSKQRRPRS